MSDDVQFGATPSFAECLILSILLPLCCRNCPRNLRDTKFLCYLLHPIVDAESILVYLVTLFRMLPDKRRSIVRSRNHGDGRDEDPPDQSSLAEFMLEMERNKRESNRLLACIEENTAQQCKGSATIHDFIRLHPPTFHHPIEPLDADDWLRSITQKLRSANVAESDKVIYAAYHLEGPASLWWQNYEAMLPVGQIPTWREFTEVFREHHIPEALIDRKREEFCSFTQG